MSERREVEPRNPHDPANRVAVRDPQNCAAYGCTMLGTTSSSTTGGGDFFCCLHAGRDAAEWQSITAETHRNQWLADLVRLLRTSHSKPTWADAVRKTRTVLKACQRDDLQCGEIETAWSWIARLERALIELVSAK